MSIDTAALAIEGGPSALDGAGDFPGWPIFGLEEEHGVLEVLHSGAWGSTQGHEVEEFEAEFADLHRAKHAVATTSCTVGIAASLRAAGIGMGDEVIVPPYTFIATASAALLVGAVPVFADIDPRSHLLDPAAAESVISDRTKAIIPVHLAGNVADPEIFADIGRRHGLIVIEDCAQAAGASWKGQPVGTFGDIGVFSFQSSKNMTAGEGGLIITNDDKQADALYSQVNVGRSRGGGWYQHEVIGSNLRMTEFQAAILRAQISRFPAQQSTRDANAAALLSQLETIDGVRTDRVEDDVTAHGHHLLIFRVPDIGANGWRATAAAALTAEGVPGVSTGYSPLHHNPAILHDTEQLARRLGQPVPHSDCPGADLVGQDTLWLPHNVLLGTEEQIDAVGRAIAKVVTAADRLERIDGRR